MKDNLAQVRAPLATRQHGSATVLALGWLSAVMIVLSVLLVSTAVLATAHRADNAADLAALSGAVHASEGEAAACTAALRVTQRMAGTLESCTLDGLVLTVVVRASFPGEAGRWNWRSEATAGPATLPVSGGG